MLDNDGNVRIVSPAGENITFLPGKSEKVRITTDGNVGIGTTNPGAKLEVLGEDALTVGSNIALWIANDGGDVKYDQIGFGIKGSAKPSAAMGGVVESGTGNFASGLFFATRSSVTASDAPIERVRISKDGNVGIGTTAPEAKLHVQGFGKRRRNIYNSFWPFCWEN